MPAKTRIWVDGDIVDYEDATTHVLSHSLHYGLAVFEGIRAYKTTGGGTAVFRLRDHTKRLVESCQIAMLDIPYSVEQLDTAILEVLRTNELEDGYIRPLVWLGEGSIKVAPSDNPVRTAIAAWPWGAYLGEEALEKGIRCCVSSYTRMGIRSHFEKAKLCGQYTNSVMAKREALMTGYDEGILLDHEGYVTEGSGENIFVVKDGVIRTPPTGASILAGITRSTIMTLARDRGLDVREESLTRSSLYVADEVFLVGTAAEVTPVREIDERQIGAGVRGEITTTLQRAYFAAVRGEDDRHADWCTAV